MDKVSIMARKKKATQVPPNKAQLPPTPGAPNPIFNGITIPQPSGEVKKGPKIETCEVGLFRLPGVKVDLNQYHEDEVKEMLAWAKDNDAYVVEDKGLFSWRKEAKRDWFILRWG